MRTLLFIGFFRRKPKWTLQGSNGGVYRALRRMYTLDGLPQYHSILSRPRIILDDRNALPIRCAG